ncbi:hypothetical protein OKA04_21500 [Luteolibacter flavescens]|uniref:Uncharacterized protein n=1 Tax=Luteolibacter flavescens TaxID=1859460 RepID=A0ABT3FUR1_9BACT|nr:hypothetical protein [Luteolibacter flavescens]MCW1887328.1 hypothetical protein [Luteolibacter flavescens]
MSARTKWIAWMVQESPRCALISSKVRSGGLTHLAVMGGKDDGLAIAAVVERFDGPEVLALGEALLAHARGNLEALGDLGACGATAVVGVYDALAQIEWLGRLLERGLFPWLEEAQVRVGKL